MVSARTVAREAAKTVMSGPASGVMAATYTARRAGISNLITYDMGGTSTDVALIRDGAPPVSSEIELEYAMPIHVPMVDVRTVGAGGGSIARLTPSGLLEVGPDCAGAHPGPIASGRGGTHPTITDANLLLGRLDPARFPAIEDARRILTETIAAPLALTPEAAAEAILRIADTRCRTPSAWSPSPSAPTPATSPSSPSAAPARSTPPPSPASSASPASSSPPAPASPTRSAAPPPTSASTSSAPSPAPSPPSTSRDVHAILATHDAQGRALIAAEPVPTTAITTTHTAEMQFVGQTHLLRVPLPSATPTLADLHTLFEAAYLARFRVELPEIRPALVNLATSVTGHRPPLDLTLLLDPTARRPTLAEAQTATRPVWFEGAWHPTPIYRRDHLPADRHPHRPRPPRADGHHHPPPPRRPPHPGRRRQPPHRDRLTARTKARPRHRLAQPAHRDDRAGTVITRLHRILA